MFMFGSWKKTEHVFMICELNLRLLFNYRNNGCLR